MNIVRFTDTVDRFRSLARFRREDMPISAKVGLTVAAAALTGLAAQIRIPLPFTPVPATGQVFAVLLSGALLGAAWGGASQLLYVGLGAAGVPWFSGWAAGLPFGPTAGYLLGFVPAAAFVGWASDRFAGARSFVPQVFLMLCAVGIIYLFGAIGFSATTGAGLKTTLALAVGPFIAVDCAKAIAAAAISSALTAEKSPRPDTRDE